MSNLHTLSVAEIATGLANKDFSSLEMTTHLLGRIDTLNKDLNSFITVTAEQALEQAKAADALRARWRYSCPTGRTNGTQGQSMHPRRLDHLWLKDAVQFRLTV